MTVKTTDRRDLNTKQEEHLSSATDSFAFKQKTNKPKLLASLFICAISACWIVVLNLFDTTFNTTTLPWQACLCLIAVIALLNTKENSAIPDSFVLLPARKQSRLDLMHTFALSYLLASALLGLIYLGSIVIKDQAKTVTKQVIDIQLCDRLDYEDKQSPLPATKEEEALKKQSSLFNANQKGEILVKQALAASKQIFSPHGVTVPQAPANKAKEVRPTSTKANVISKEPKPISLPDVLGNTKPTEAPTKPQAKPTQTKAYEYKAESIPFSQITNFVKTHLSANKTVTASQKSRPDSILEEVSPTELTEIIDNDGADKGQMYQSGGRSSGGKGNQSNFADYLKDLNRRIKSNWHPTTTQSKRVEILFRINKLGKLVKITVTKSSGDSKVDQSALEAITASFPTGPIPADFTSSLLDLQYSFSYSVDQLKEVNALP